MKIVGRRWSEAEEDAYPLDQITITCTLDEMNRLLLFVKGLKRAYEQGRKKAEMCYSHFRDYDEDWTADMPDIAIIKRG